MRAHNDHLALLPEAERQALYDRPEFDDFQRAGYFAFTADELALAERRRGLNEQILCLLQTGYFKATRAFFTFTELPLEDAGYLRERYFPQQALSPRLIRSAEIYAQRREILSLFRFRLWSKHDSPSLTQRTAQLVRRDVTPAYVVTELIIWLNQQHIVRPGHTTFQTIISTALREERQRLAALIEAQITDDVKASLQGLLVRDESLSELAAIKQDAKYFGPHMMGRERRKRATLEPVYNAARPILPQLGISQQNIAYYASLAHFYTIYDLRQPQPGQSFLYLLCYAWQRYRQLNDNLVDALRHHTKKFEDDSKASADHAFIHAKLQRQKDTPQVGRLLQLYVDDSLDNVTPFGIVRHQAFSILPKADLQQVASLLSTKPLSQMELRWQAVDEVAGQIRTRLRPRATTLQFSSARNDDPWLAALHWMRGVFARRQRLDRQPIDDIPPNTIPERLRPYLLTFGDRGQPTALRGDRYEFWVYRQLRKRIDSGDLPLNDSTQHRQFSDHLVPADRTAAVLDKLDLA